MIQIKSFLTPVRLAIGAAALVALLVLAWYLTEPTRANQRATEARANSAVAEGRAKSAGEAVDIVAGRAETERLTEQTTRENRDAILNAPGASAPVDPGVHDAGRRAICVRQSARCLPECVALLGPCS